jgi:hypothetical protein
MPLVVVMARVPVPGRVKTRLVPALGAEGAAALCEAMTRDVFALVAASGLPWRVAWEGPADHPWVAALPVANEPQAPGGLGERLAWALREGGIAIGTDAPTLPVGQLVEAASTLGEDDSAVVLGPAADGGYTLVGVHADAVRRGVFDRVPWSGPGTLAGQVARARALDLRVRLLDGGHDVDDPADVTWLREHLEHQPEAVAAATRAWFRSQADPAAPAAR